MFLAFDSIFYENAGCIGLAKQFLCIGFVFREKAFVSRALIIEIVVPDAFMRCLYTTFIYIFDDRMLFQTAIGVDLTTVPYKGTGPAMNDMLGGQVDLMCYQTTNTTSQIKSGKVKVYGVTTKARLASMPNVPTMSEAGLPCFEVAVWHGMYAPKGTPKPVIDTLSNALRAALKDPTVKQRFADLGTEPVAENRARPEALRAHVKAEIDRWGPIITKAGQYAD